MDKIKGYRTIIFNVAMLLVSSPEILALIPPKYAIPVAAIGNVFLRIITTTPVGISEPKS